MNQQKYILLILMCFVILFQSCSNNGNSFDKPFITSDVKLPQVISFYGLAYPSSQELLKKSVPTSTKAQQSFNETISKCLKDNWYDPDSEHKLISLKDWQDISSTIRIEQFERNGYMFHVCDANEELFIGIKRINGNYIWDMKEQPDNFISKTIETFFKDENVGPLSERTTHFAANKDGSDGFYYYYPPKLKKDLWAAYLWTNGKIIVLNLSKNFEDGKKIYIRKNYSPKKPI